LAMAWRISRSAWSISASQALPKVSTP